MAPPAAEAVAAVSTARSSLLEECGDESSEQQQQQQQQKDAARKLIARAKAMLSCENNNNNKNPDPTRVWGLLHQRLLSPHLHHFNIHRQCYEMVYAGTEIRPSWIPSTGSSGSTTANNKTKTTHVEQHMERLGFATYQELYEWSVARKNDFWMRAAETVGIEWITAPSRALLLDDDDEDDPTQTQYYPGARLNIAESCFKGSDDDLAVLYANDCDPTNLQQWTVAELRQRSYAVAHRIGTVWQFPPGTRIAVCLPLTPESLAVYLGIVLAGCAVVSVADSFSASEIALRLQAADARAVFTQDVVWRASKPLPLHARVVEASDAIAMRERAVAKEKQAAENEDGKESKSEDDAVETNETVAAEQQQRRMMKVVVLPAALHAGPYNNNEFGGGNDEEEKQQLHPSIQLRPGLDWSWRDFLNGDAAESSPSSFAAAVPRDSMDACNILFSSGTTGAPKAIVWHHATPIKCAADGYYHQDIGPDDRVAWPTNMGWMMGPWLLYQRINGAAICLYQGLPHTPGFCKFVEKAGVTMLGVIPSLVKQWQARDSCSQADWSKIRRFSSTGEASDPVNYLWLQSRVPGYAPVIEYCGGTEIGGSFLSSTLAHANVPSMFATPCLGSEIRLVEAESGRVLPESEYRPMDNSGSATAASGELVLLPPAVGLSTRLLHRNHFDCYYRGMPTHNNRILRRHGDEMQVVRSTSHSTPYFRALGRVDDTMNLGGIKVSSVEIERVCNAVDAVKETAAIAVPTGGPCKLVVYAVLLSQDYEIEPKELQKAMQLSIKQGLNPLFGISDVVVKESLPRTASNKIMRRLLRDEYIQASA